MLEQVKNFFRQAEVDENPHVLTAKQEREKAQLWAIWHSMDKDLKEFSQQVIDLGRHNAKLKLNQKGICVLVRELDKRGFEITKKADIVQND